MHKDPSEKILKYENINNIVRLRENNSNKTLHALALRKYKYYSRKIGMSKTTYDIMKKTYNSLGQFSYFDRRETKHIQIKEGLTKDNKKYVSVFATIYGKVYTVREIIVYEFGMVYEYECDSRSALRRGRTLYSNGD